jgi:hypothetical protein
LANAAWSFVRSTVLQRSIDRARVFGEAIVKKTIVAAAVPQDWDAEALYAKAQRYIERMQDEPSDGSEHALWSSLALELLARAALSNVSPALLADTSERNWQHLFHSLGFTPTGPKFSPRSIVIGEVLKRLKDILPEFDNELEAFVLFTPEGGMRSCIQGQRLSMASRLHPAGMPSSIGRASCS